jgi:hypothetical protein
MRREASDFILTLEENCGRRVLMILLPDADFTVADFQLYFCTNLTKAERKLTEEISAVCRENYFYGVHGALISDPRKIGHIFYMHAFNTSVFIIIQGLTHVQFCSLVSHALKAYNGPSSCLN